MKNPKQASLRRNLIFGCSAIFVGALFVSGIFGWIFTNDETMFLFTNQRSRFSVSQSFVRALRLKRLDVAQSLVVEELKPELGSWMENKEPIRCPLRIDFEQTGWSVGSFSDDGAKFTETIVVSLPCPESSQMYCLKVTDLRTKQQGNIWLVVGWDDITEGFSSFTCR